MAGKTIENNTVHVDKLENESYLPIANVSRIMKKSLPTNAKISKDAKETVQQCVSEFISFVTGEASDKCHREKRKTITGDDLLWAMTTLGFQNYVRNLQVYLKYYKCGTIGDITQTSEGASVMEENSSSAKTNDTVISEGNIEKTTTNSAHVCDSLPDFKRSLGLSPNTSYSVIHYGEQY